MGWTIAANVSWERKVRTPQGRVTANGRTQQVGFGPPKARNRATETSNQPAKGMAEDVKRGNLHPEQHQVGAREACP